MGVVNILNWKTDKITVRVKNRKVSILLGIFIDQGNQCLPDVSIRFLKKSGFRPQRQKFFKLFNRLQIVLFQQISYSSTQGHFRENINASSLSKYFFVSLKRLIIRLHIKNNIPYFQAWLANSDISHSDFSVLCFCGFFTNFVAFFIENRLAFFIELTISSFSRFVKNSQCILILSLHYKRITDSI